MFHVLLPQRPPIPSRQGATRWPALWIDFTLEYGLLPHLERAGQEDVQSFFSVSYQEAREKFLAAAKNAGAEISHCKNPEPGIHGVPLFTDTASFNLKGAETIVVIGSGTHGVKGYSGSGIQTGLLRSDFLTQLEPRVGVLFYHALNPYGFSHLRRVNEDNVDLNRNFVDHSSSHSSNDAYDRLASLLEPDALSR